MDDDGGVTWAQQVEGTNLNIRSFLTCDVNGNLIMGGNFNEMVYLGNTAFDAGEFSMDAFVAKLDSEGSFIWARQAVSPADNDLIAIDTDADGNVYSLGHFLLDVTFDDVALIYTLCCGSREISMVSYSGHGMVL